MSADIDPAFADRCAAAAVNLSKLAELSARPETDAHAMMGAAALTAELLADPEALLAVALTIERAAAPRAPLDPTRKFSEGGAPEHRAALGIDCPACTARAGAWCPMPGTTWNLCGARIEAAR